mgnify:FL=1
MFRVDTRSYLATVMDMLIFGNWTNALQEHPPVSGHYHAFQTCVSMTRCANRSLPNPTCRRESTIFDGVAGVRSPLPRTDDPSVACPAHLPACDDFHAASGTRCCSIPMAVVARATSQPVRMMRFTAINANSDLLGVARLSLRHFLTSFVGRGVRRARSVSSTAGLFAAQIIPSGGVA